MRRLTGILAGTSALALLAGCGTTVHGTRAAGDSTLGVTNGPVGGQSGSSSAVGTTGGQPTNAGGGSPANPYVATGGTAPAGQPAGATVTSGGSGGLVPSSAPGITATTVYIGVQYSSQSAEGDQAVGAAGAAPSYDYRGVFSSVAAYANSHGGFAGRKLQPIYYDFNLTDDQNTQDQAACSSWTQDHKVFMIISGVDDILDSCAEKAHAIPFGSGTASTFAKYPHLIDPEAIRLDRLGAVTVNGLFRANYFTGKLGLVTWDDPNYRYTMTHGYLPALASHHITPTETAYIMVPQQLGALGDMSAAVSSAVTKFKAMGIDHVIVQDGAAGVWGGTGLTLEWMDQAKSQDYYPRYGQNAYNSPGWNVLPSDQMDHALAIDQSDYDAKFDVGWHTNADREKCLRIEADAGYPVASSNPNDEVAAEASCDEVFFLQRVINGLSSISADSFIQATGALGTSVPSAEVYGTKFVAGRRDGGDMVRTEEYLASCKCMHYSGPPYYAD